MAKQDKNTNEDFQDPFELCKKDAEKQFQEIVDIAKEKIEEIKHTTAIRIEDVLQNSANVKKDLDKIIHEDTEEIKSIEKEALKTLNNTWNESKVKLQGVYNSSTTALGNSVKLDNMKLMVNFFDQTLKTYTGIIHESVQESVKHVKSMAKDQRKSDASSSTQ